MAGIATRETTSLLQHLRRVDPDLPPQWMICGKRWMNNFSSSTGGWKSCEGPSTQST